MSSPGRLRKNSRIITRPVEHIGGRKERSDHLGNNVMNCYILHLGSEVRNGRRWKLVRWDCLSASKALSLCKVGTILTAVHFSTHSVNHT
jgi:hypothetical protein